MISVAYSGAIRMKTTINSVTQIKVELTREEVLEALDDYLIKVTKDRAINTETFSLAIGKTRGLIISYSYENKE